MARRRCAVQTARDGAGGGCGCEVDEVGGGGMGAAGAAAAATPAAAVAVAAVTWSQALRLMRDAATLPQSSASS